MKIVKIEVKKLFGMFDHEINLKTNDRATIIISPNGYGKTTILKLINSLFSGDLSPFFLVVFDEFCVNFDDSTTIAIKKKKSSKGKSTGEDDLQIIIREAGRNERSFYMRELFTDKFSRLAFMAYNVFGEADTSYRRLLHAQGIKDVEEYSTFLEKILKKFDPDEYEGSRIKELTKFREYLSESGVEKEIKDLLRIKKMKNVHFVKTQRLVTYLDRSPERYERSERFERLDRTKAVVSLHGEELSKLIGDTLAESSQQAQKLDSTFPKRVINRESSEGRIDEYLQLLSEIETLRMKRMHLQDIGILVDLGEDLGISENIDDVSRLRFLNGVLSEYIADTEAKLAMFDELANKIDLLKKIINNRFTFKRLAIDREEGFVITTNQGEEIPADSLSSGEQHELVLFYEFLFKVPKHSLLLIDEPELSLHVDWQQHFLSDLIEIANLTDFDVLVATHAPSIIDKFWDLTVDLGEHKEDNYA